MAIPQLLERCARSCVLFDHCNPKENSGRYILRKVLTNILFQCGVGITSASNLGLLRENQLELFILRRYMEFNSKLDSSSLPKEIRRPSLEEFSKSTGQLNQDLIAQMFLDFRHGGYFVEFGATDGERYSNSHLLEKTFKWKGILAEPGKRWHQSLKKNRTAIIETKCVWKSSGDKLEFNETEVGEISTLEMFSAGDLHAEERKSGNRYFVETISLEDLLDQNGAPEFIDYLSIDTEGSELQILSNFNFGKYTFGFISCEHNYTESRKQVADLFAAHGYIRVLVDMSLFDDWFVHNSLIKAKGFI